MFREYRKKLNLTQEALVDKTDLNTRTIQRIENEEEIPSLETLSKLVNALEIKDKDLIEYIKGKLLGDWVKARRGYER